MDYQVIWTDEALTDVEEIAEYISKDSLYYAGAVVTNIINQPKKTVKKPKPPKAPTIADTESFVELVDEYIKQNEYAREFKLRGKVVKAKDSQEKADKLAKRIKRKFAKGKIVTLVFGDEFPIDQNYMFQTNRWKMRYYYFNEVKPDGKPKDWWTSKRNSIKAESFKPGKKYRVKFKVLEDIKIPYGGTMSFFSLNIKFVDIDILG